MKLDFRSSFRLLVSVGQASFIERLERIRRESHNWGWGVGDYMDDLMAEYGFAQE